MRQGLHLPHVATLSNHEPFKVPVLRQRGIAREGQHCAFLSASRPQLRGRWQAEQLGLQTSALDVGQVPACRAAAGQREAAAHALQLSCRCRGLQIEKLGLLTKAEKFGLLSTLERLLTSDPAAISSLSIPAFVASLCASPVASCQFKVAAERNKYAHCREVSGVNALPLHPRLRGLPVCVPRGLLSTQVRHGKSRDSMRIAVKK